MVTGPNHIPDIKNIASKPEVAPVRRTPIEPTVKHTPQSAGRVVQAADSVHLSPRAHEASRVRSSVERTPEVRPERVQQASAQVRSQSSNSASANAKLAEKLLTEN